MVGPLPPSGYAGTPWPPGRIRLELRQLTDDLHVWGPFRAEDVGASFVRRANRVLLHLRSQPDGRQRRLPPEFAFTAGEIVEDDGTVTAAGADRLAGFVAELAAQLPGGGVAPRTALPLAPLHPRVASACADDWRTGRLVAAVEAARDAVLARLAVLAGLSPSPSAPPEPRSLLAATLDAGRVVVGPPGGSEQAAVSALARGLVDVVAGVRQLPAERFGPDRAFEILALASLVLHRLEFAGPAAPAHPAPAAVRPAAVPAPTARSAEGALRLDPADPLGLHLPQARGRR
jgi:hypothetical protein